MDNNQELYHYGVLGMKWGVRRGKADQAYGKAKKKLDKLDTKVEKRAARLDRAIDRYDRVTSSAFSTSTGRRALRAKRKLDKATIRYKKAIKKGSDWYKSMEKTFANTSIKFDQDVIDSGKNYAEIRNARRMNRLG